MSLKFLSDTDVDFQRSAASPRWENLAMHLIQRANRTIHGYSYSKSDPQPAIFASTDVIPPCSDLIRKQEKDWEGFLCRSWVGDNHSVIQVCPKTLCCESDRAVFKFSLSRFDPSPLSFFSPISLIRHSHTHIRWSPFCFTFWMAGCSSRHHKKNCYAKQAAFRSGGNHQKTAHTLKAV